LDLDSITSASQMLSAETDLEQLLSKMITLVMANSGAETAVLLRKQDNDWFVQARGDIRSKDQEVLLNQPLDSLATDGTRSVPESVHLYCRRSNEVLVVGDARSDDRFAKDKTVQARDIRSMACIPVLAKGECKSMLYLENCQVPDTFTEERMELLKHLSSQFGISAENALLNANLIKSEKQFRRLMEQSPLAIELLEPNGQISRVNGAWRKLWGLSKEGATQVLVKYNIRKDPQFEDQAISHLVEKAFSGQNVVLPPFKYDANRTLDDFEIEGIKGLKQPWIQCNLYSIKNSNGEIIQVVNVCMDMSELKYAEMEAQKQKEKLALVGRASRMGQLTGSIAHELNQPLTGILSNAQSAESMMKMNLWEKEEFRDIIGDIISDTKRAGEVIRNLRDLYREQKIEFHPIDINSVLDDALRLLHSEFIIQHVKLTQEIHPFLR
jgi:PAS domain-containing protein